jgi:hypothetical protein
MQQKNILLAVGGGGLSAIASLAFLSGVPGGLLFVYFAMLPIFMVAFSMGTMAASIAALSGIVLAGMVGDSITAAAYGAFHAFPAWFISRQSLASRQMQDGTTVWRTSGAVLSALSLLCAVMMVFGALIFSSITTSDIEQGINTILYEAFAQIIPTMGGDELTQMIGTMASIFPGVMGGSWVIMIIINAIMSQAAVVRMDRNIRPSPTYLNMALPHWVAWPLVISAAASLILSGDANYIARNSALILATPFFFLGLSVVHWAVRRISFATALLSFFYLIMVMSGWAIMLVAAIGMIEQWAGIRSRFNETKNTNLTPTEKSDRKGHNGQE